MKIREKKIKLNTEKSIVPGAVFLGLLAAVIIYAVMINAEKNALTAYEKGIIYVAAQEIPEGQLVTTENMDIYFKQLELDAAVIPETAISTPDELIGLIPEISIDAGTLITGGMFESVNEATGSMKEPVIAGCKADDLYQLAGGVLRADDRIHIYKVDEDGRAYTAPQWEKIFVQAVFDQTGLEISNADHTSAAQRINIYIEKEDVENFYSELSSGMLRVVKVLD